MVIAYHAIFTTYGTWLPNDPRGSYSKEIYQAELAALGPIAYGRQWPQPSRPELRRFWVTARTCLDRSPFLISDKTRPVVAAGFAVAVERLGLVVYECSIMNDHVHIVVERSTYRIEYVVNQLKGAATHAMGLAETPWTRKGWKVLQGLEGFSRPPGCRRGCGCVRSGQSGCRWPAAATLGFRVTAR